MSGVKKHVFIDTYRLSPTPVTCHMSQMPTTTAREPPKANLPARYGRLVRKDQKDKIYFFHMAILAPF